MHPSPGFLSRLEARLAAGEGEREPLPPRVPGWAVSAAAALFVVLIGASLRDLAIAPRPVAAESEPGLVLVQPRLLPGLPFVLFVPANR